MATIIETNVPSRSSLNVVRRRCQVVAQAQSRPAHQAFALPVASRRAALAASLAILASPANTRADEEAAASLDGTAPVEEEPKRPKKKEKKKLTRQEELELGQSVVVPKSAATEFRRPERTALKLNQKIQIQNNVPVIDFPWFVRDGYDIKILVDDGFEISAEGLIYKDFVIGDGPLPEDKQQVTYDYTGYNENGAKIDSTYNKGIPQDTLVGYGTLIPGFEIGVKGMRVGGKRRIIITPELGPPTGPATFFSAKQCEVFDIELRAIKSCRREQALMFSKLICE